MCLFPWRIFSQTCFSYLILVWLSARYKRTRSIDLSRWSFRNNPSSEHTYSLVRSYYYVYWSEGRLQLHSIREKILERLKNGGVTWVSHVRHGYLINSLPPVLPMTVFPWPLGVQIPTETFAPDTILFSTPWTYDPLINKMTRYLVSKDPDLVSQTCSLDTVTKVLRRPFH